MLISNESANKRLTSPLNLINSLRNSNGDGKAKKAMSLFIKPISEVERTQEPDFKSTQQPATGVIVNPFSRLPVIPVPEILEPAKQEPTSEDIISDSDDSKMKLALAHDKALDVLTSAVTRLGNEIPSISANKLPSVIAATSKVVESIRKERLERDRNNKDREVHYHFYTPQQKQIADYNVIDVTP